MKHALKIDGNRHAEAIPFAFCSRAVLTALFAAAVSLSSAMADIPQGLVEPGAELVHIAGGFAFTEGPTANSRGDVYFTDSHRDHILKWSIDGELSTFRKPSGGAVGLFFDHEDNLLVCAGSDKKLLSISPDGVTTVLANTYNGIAFNRPNDVFSHPEAGIYFTDPRGRRGGDEAASRVFHLSPDYTTLTSIIEDMIYPNGVAASPDGATLYVADWSAKEIYSFDIEENGALSNRRIFAREECDGMTLDEHGNLYFGGSEGVSVYSPQGERLGFIKVPEFAANVCFGGADRKTLFITARSSLYALKMDVSGGY